MLLLCMPLRVREKGNRSSHDVKIVGVVYARTKQSHAAGGGGGGGQDAINECCCKEGENNDFF